MKKPWKILAGLSLALGLVGCTSSTPEEVATVSATPTPVPTPTTETTTVNMLVTGDALIHGAVYKDAYQSDGTYDFSDMFEDIKPIVQKYDLAYYNQETILGGDELGFFSYPTFNTPQAYGTNMVDIGFNMVSNANNHCLDMGETGITNSMNFWKQYPNVVTAGTYLSQEERDEMPVHDINGISYAFLSYTYGMNGLLPPEGKEYLVNQYTDEMLLDDIAKVRDKVDVLMVAMHWGVEYTHTPTDEQVRLANLLADAGVDIVIGCHPHVIQPITWIGDTLVFYSLGNFISSQDRTDRLIGMLGALTITKTTTDGVSTITISDPKADLIYSYHDSSLHNYRVVPFENLDDSLLPGYQDLQTEYAGYIQAMDPSIPVGPLE